MAKNMVRLRTSICWILKFPLNKTTMTGDGADGIGLTTSLKNSLRTGLSPEQNTPRKKKRVEWFLRDHLPQILLEIISDIYIYTCIYIIYNK